MGPLLGKLYRTAVRLAEIGDIGRERVALVLFIRERSEDGGLGGGGRGPAGVGSDPGMVPGEVRVKHWNHSGTN